MKKAKIFLVVAEVVGGLLELVALVGNMIVDSKEAKEIDCNVVEDTKNKQ